MTKRYTDEESLALFCSKCDTCLEDTIGKVRVLREEETFESDLYNVTSFSIDAGWFLMNVVGDFCPGCGDEISL